MEPYSILSGTSVGRGQTLRLERSDDTYRVVLVRPDGTTTCVSGEAKLNSQEALGFMAGYISSIVYSNEHQAGQEVGQADERLRWGRYILEWASTALSFGHVERTKVLYEVADKLSKNIQD